MHAEIFCRVIDNYGDVGVCWRLARQLAETHGFSVRLWLDCPEALTPLLPDEIVLKTLAITRQPWREDLPLSVLQSVADADLVIEAFACELPSPCLEAMAARRIPPVWLNLEYLSAEDWVADCHGLCSRHPQTGPDKHFFFPGFGAGTGGLLREKDLFAQRDAFQADALAQARFWQQLGLDLPATGQQQVSLFCYDTAPVSALLTDWAGGMQSVRCLVAAGQAQTAVARWLAGQGMAIDDKNNTAQTTATVCRCGSLQLVFLPFLSQTDFDRLLWISDVNFVRGEDSLVRAIWAGKPFIWQIYKQAEDAHFAKLDAFMAQHPALCAASLGLPCTPWRQFWLGWNASPDGSDWPHTRLPDWQMLNDHLPRIRLAQQAWLQGLAAQPDLATRICSQVATRNSSI